MQPCAPSGAQGCDVFLSAGSELCGRFFFCSFGGFKDLRQQHPRDDGDDLVGDRLCFADLLGGFVQDHELFTQSSGSQTYPSLSLTASFIVLLSPYFSMGAVGFIRVCVPVCYVKCSASFFYGLKNAGSGGQRFRTLCYRNRRDF